MGGGYLLLNGDILFLGSGFSRYLRAERYIRRYIPSFHWSDIEEKTVGAAKIATRGNHFLRVHSVRLARADRKAKRNNCFGFLIIHCGVLFFYVTATNLNARHPRRAPNQDHVVNHSSLRKTSQLGVPLHFSRHLGHGGYLQQQFVHALSRSDLQLFI